MGRSRARSCSSRKNSRPRDTLAEPAEESSQLGIIAFAVEVIYADPDSALIRREEGGYSPPSDVLTYQSHLCTDWRRWVKKAFSREAYEWYEYTSGSEDEDDDEEQPDDS